MPTIEDLLREENIGKYDWHIGDQHRVANAVEKYLESHPGLSNYELEAAIDTVSRDEGRSINKPNTDPWYRISPWMDYFLPSRNLFLGEHASIHNINIKDAIRKLYGHDEKCEMMVHSFRQGCKRKQNMVIFFKTEEGLKEYISSRVKKSEVLHYVFDEHEFRSLDKH